MHGLREIFGAKLQSLLRMNYTDVLTFVLSI